MGHNSRAKRQNTYNSGKGTEGEMARTLDQLIEFDNFIKEVAPKLRQMLKQGKNAQEILTWAQSIAAAKAVTLINSPNPAIALSAIKDVLDRGIGKPSETLNINTKYEALSDEELETILKSKEAEVKDDDMQSH